MNLGITIEEASCCICGKAYESKKDFAMIVSYHEALYFCETHREGIGDIMRSVKLIIEQSERKKIKAIRIRVDSLRPQLKIFRKDL